MKPFYYVYNYGNKAPRIRHSTLEKAQEEAERLAAKHPGLSFEILQCVGVSSTSKASTFWADGCGPSKQTTQESDNEWHYLKEGDMIRGGDQFFGKEGWRTTLSPGVIMMKCDEGNYRRKLK